MTQTLRRLFRHSRTSRLKALRMLFRIATPVALLAAAYVALAGSLAERQLWLMLCGVVFVGALLAWVGVSGELKSRRRPF